MNIEQFRKLCLSLKATSEGTPFGPDVVVFKVKSKMFATMSLNPPHTANLKNSPEQILELREAYEEVIPGYHMNKRHWNTVSIESEAIPDKEIENWILESYRAVVKGLPQKEREELI
jgi:predicted DNA-binding protein (MmcQ/YjbR family)